MNDIRQEALLSWARNCLQEVLGTNIAEAQCEVVSGDASFRRYFRLRLPTSALGGAIPAAPSYILVDAPPEHEDCQRFVLVADALREAGLAAPIVHEVDYYLGFMLLQDFGDTLYLPALLEAQQKEDFRRADVIYGQAIDSLVRMQHNCRPTDFPPYDKALLHRELELFDVWFCGEFLRLELNQDEQELVDQTYDFLEEAALAQPVVCVHRDYHSRNLMVRDGIENQPPGIVDFQDAVAGAYTYDLVSLLRDCYIIWPQDKVRLWALDYLDRARDLEIVSESLEEEDFLRDFDLMGLQRHLKVIGIFCRLCIRDGKSRYLQDIPQVINYVLHVADNYPELNEFTAWFRARLLVPAMERLRP